MPTPVDPVNLLWWLFAVLVVAIATLDLVVIAHRHGQVGMNNALRWVAMEIGRASCRERV